MLKLVPEKTVQWTDGGKHYVGTVMVSSVSGVSVLCRHEATRLLVRCEPDGELAVISSARLSPYPSEPIPEPGPVRKLAEQDKTPPAAGNNAAGKPKPRARVEERNGRWVIIDSARPGRMARFGRAHQTAQYVCERINQGDDGAEFSWELDGQATPDARVEEVLDSLRGPRDEFRKQITAVEELMAAVCDYAEELAKRKRCEPWSIIGQITSHGSGVSQAIYELYRRQGKDVNKP